MDCISRVDMLPGKRKMEMPMRKAIPALLILAVLAASLLGCGTNSKELWIKCPKCGYYFNTKEGVEFLRLERDRY